MNSEVPVVIIGGGSAGLATSFELSANGIEHVVLERGFCQRSHGDRTRQRGMTVKTDGRVIENTGPPPDGDRYQDATPVRAFWERFVAEEQFTAGDRCAVRWRNDWRSGHLARPRRSRIEDICRANPTPTRSHDQLGHSTAAHRRQEGGDQGLRPDQDGRGFSDDQNQDETCWL